MSNEIEYIEPTQEHVGQVVEVRDSEEQEWRRGELIAVINHEYGFVFKQSGYAWGHCCKFARIPCPKPLPTKTIDWTKPVRTKDGRAVRVLCTDGPGVYQVIGLVDGECRAWSWTLGGIQNTGTTGPCDLENVPQRIQRGYWVNVYQNGLGTRL